MKNIDSYSDTSAEHISYIYFTYVDTKRPVSPTSDTVTSVTVFSIRQRSLMPKSNIVIDTWYVKMNFNEFQNDFN